MRKLGDMQRVKLIIIALDVLQGVSKGIISDLAVRGSGLLTDAHNPVDMQYFSG
jgi:hypothetical protein